MNNHMHILLIAKADDPSTRNRFYKVSHNTLYLTHEAEQQRNWDRPIKTVVQEEGAWLDFDTFQTLSYTIISKGNSRWKCIPRNGDASIMLTKTWYWRTPNFESPKLDPRAGIGAQLDRLWADGKIMYLQDQQTLYDEERNQQYGFTNFQRIVKFDRNSRAWFIYDEAKMDFKPVTALVENETFLKLKVEELYENMFKPAPSKAWENFRWSMGKAADIAGPMVLTAVAGVFIGARGSKK
jgi:hypothetical protein